MQIERLAAIVEALLLAADEPLSLQRLARLVPEVERRELREALARLEAHYRLPASGHGVELVEVAGGWRFRTRAELQPWVRRLFAETPLRLGRAQLETLAVVAYRQPVTRAEIEAVRGVDVGGTLRTLLERGLVRIVGRKELPGRPQLYGTTPKFLEVFGLKSLDELPPLEPELAEALQGQLPLDGEAASTNGTDTGADPAQGTGAQPSGTASEGTDASRDEEEASRE